MEAHFSRAAIMAACLLSLGASYRTQNFLVTASTPQLAQQVAASAENYRRDLALQWLGGELKPWSAPCPIRVMDGPQLGAGGETSFMFEQGRPFGWRMAIQGSRERILDSVLPHEITHTIFATHFGRPLPRWADEGACTTVEHKSERGKQERMLVTFLTTDRGISFNDMFSMMDYPSDMLPLYSQGYSLARYLIAQGGRQKFIRYVGEGMKTNNWPSATKNHYGFTDLSDLQVTWLDWVRRGSPRIAPSALLASSGASSGGAKVAAASHQVAAKNQNLAASQSGRLVPVAPLDKTEQQSFAANALAASSLGANISGSNAAAGRGAAKHSRQGWYAKLRDTAYADRSRRKSAPNNSSLTASRSSQFTHQTATRLQPVGHPRQMVLEWSLDRNSPSQNQNTANAATEPVTAAAALQAKAQKGSAATKGYYAAPPREPGSYMR